MCNSSHHAMSTRNLHRELRDHRTNVLRACLLAATGAKWVAACCVTCQHIQHVGVLQTRLNTNIARASSFVPMEDQQQTLHHDIEMTSFDVNAANTHQSGSLFDLPPETWIQICKLAVEYEGPIMIDSMPCLDEAAYQHRPGPSAFRWTRPERCAHTKCTNERDRLKQPGIARTCRAIRQECLAHYYESNLFYSCSIGGYFWHIKPWFECLTIGHRRLLRRLYQYERDWPLGGGLKQLSESDNRDEDVEELRQYGCWIEFNNSTTPRRPLRVVYCEGENVAHA